MDGNNKAENAVDKDLSTKSVAVLKEGNELVWLNINFDETHLIHKIRIHNVFYTNWYDPSSYCVMSESNFKECIDNSNNVDVSVYQGEIKKKSCGTLQLTYGKEWSDQKYDLICNAEGDIVKLSKNTDRIEVYEIIVYGTGSYQNPAKSLKNFLPPCASGCS